MSAPFKAACVQMRGKRDPAENLDDAIRMIREAAKAGATYVQTPEISNIVNRDRPALLAAIRTEADDPMLKALSALAKELGITIHIGSLAIKNGDKVANRAFMIGQDGGLLARYDKLHLFDVDLPNGETWRESNTFTGGVEAVAVDLPEARLGMAICYDVRFPYLFRALADAGCSILSAPACFTKQTGEAHWSVLQRARAIENGAFMISAAQAGLHEDGRETYGHSIIVDPWGKVLAEAGNEPGIIMAEIDLAAVGDARGKIPALRHTRPVHVNLAKPASGDRAA
ncbi:MAG: carbon-nitrogen hydrolase family protein [Beijerinckiaceae bacterium]|nr:carbon-nitrogen hydrolase family protein [Beijerinckiaceae bacterium]